jgi:predicted pyridoxine 5'-phosphate oxidase superfamily flavin-nucleotide-binding protein
MTIFHEGELAVQRRAGVTEEARQVGKVIQMEIPPRVAAVLVEQPMVITACIGEDDQVWASLLTGAPGFLQPRDARTLDIRATPHSSDALAGTFRRGGPLGLLAIDPERRSRTRLNGVATPLPTDGLTIRSEQVYYNCQKYIQLRQPVAITTVGAAVAVRRGDHMSEPQRRMIGEADTFFVASHHPHAGLDASHRGGLPGFVRILDERRLVFPDYPGNTMFNTLGNLAADPRIGLLFVDFTDGDVLQMTGIARIVWDAKELAALGIGEAERAVEVAVVAVVDLPQASSLRWHLVENSRFNPALTQSAPFAG